MQTLNKEVKSKGKVVETVEFPKYDSVQEASEHIDGDDLLALINGAVMTKVMNTARAKYAEKKPSATQASRVKFLSQFNVEQLQQKMAEGPEAFEQWVSDGASELRAQEEAAA